MFAKLKQFLDLPPAGGGEIAQRDLELAAAVLLVEVARADYEREGAEYRVLIERLRSRFELTESEAGELLQRAEAVTDQAVSLHQHVDLINQHYQPEQKFDLLCALWAVAYGDGELHHYEEHLIRRLADLLYIPHSDFIRAKHRILSGQ